MLAALGRASLEAGVVVSIVWLLCRMLPRLSAATRTALWWCAAAKFVLALVWVAPIPLPILPDSSVAVQRAGALFQSPRAPRSPDLLPQTIASMPDPDSVAGSRLPWSFAVIGIWTAGFLLASGVEMNRWRRVRAVVRASQPAPDDLLAASARLAACIGLRRTPAVRLSPDVDTPLVTGLSKPVVLLPAGRFARLSTLHQQMALCHELVHVKRADVWFGFVPAIAERLFFFHPLARVASREYALWREAACDAAVLDALDAAPQDYGRLLLDLGVARPRVGLSAAGASWSFSILQRRILMLRDPSPRSLGVRLSTAAAAVVALALIAPVRPIARSSSGFAPAPDVAVEQQTAESPAKEKLNYIFFADDNHTTMSGSTEDVDRARRFKRPGERMLWFRHDGREYVLRNEATLQRIGALWGPMNALGQAQGQLGGKQGALGATQGTIGARQWELGAQQGMLGERQRRLAAQRADIEHRLHTTGERAAVEADRRRLEAEMRALDQETAALDRRMRELEKPMRDLDEQMRALDRDMQALDAEMRAAVARAEAEMRQLIERAIASGDAELVK